MQRNYHVYLQKLMICRIYVYDCISGKQHLRRSLSW